MFSDHSYNLVLAALQHYKLGSAVFTKLTSFIWLVSRSFIDLLSIHEMFTVCPFNFQVFKNQRYRFSILMHELGSSVLPAYQASVMAFINCLILANYTLEDRVRIRNEFTGNFIHSHQKMGSELNVNLKLPPLE